MSNKNLSQPVVTFRDQLSCFLCASFLLFKANLERLWWLNNIIEDLLDLFESVV